MRPLTPVHEARGLVLAETVVAAESVPRFANSAMDGYAVRAADTGPGPARLRVIAVAEAGTSPVLPVGPGEAMRIMTNALAMRPDGEGVPKGGPVDVLLLDAERI